jgi:UDP-2-acetamido-2,6-beta-L-arabino-hexul-4-ose reductase
LKKVCITGSDGFIGKNLSLYLSEFKEIEILKVNRDTSEVSLKEILLNSDVIIHLAGVNRPIDESEFIIGNVDYTKKIIDILIQNNLKIPLILTSSSQAQLENSYGNSKKRAEELVLDYHKMGIPVIILRLPGVFGKFCKPNYNSVVATFCYNISRNLDIKISDPNLEIKIVYIDFVVQLIRNLIFQIDSYQNKDIFQEISQVYTNHTWRTSRYIVFFPKDTKSSFYGQCRQWFLRALYATYISYLPSSNWNYEVPKYSDSRGIFVEMLKTKDSGQFSYFTAPPGTTRGEHYHHTKTEKFLVIKGNALFRFKNKISDEYFELKTSGEKPTIVDTIPGWAHDITNTGTEEMIVMLWANEVFDRNSPDTYSSKVIP